MSTANSLEEFIISTNKAQTYPELHNLFYAFLQAYSIDNFLVSHFPKDRNMIRGGDAPRVFLHQDGRSSNSKPGATLDFVEIDEGRYFSIFLHRPLGEIINIEFSAPRKTSAFDKNVLHILYAASNQFLIMRGRLLKSEPFLPEILTLREREVLLWCARGKSKNEIAIILDVTESAIKRQIESIFRKLDVNNLQLAISKALREGIIQPY